MTSKALSNAFRSARRESLIILLAWLVLGAWVIGYCGWNAYATPNSASEPIQTIFGFPDWIIWGIALPWIASNLFTFWFCLFLMRDDDKPAESKDA